MKIHFSKLKPGQYFSYKDKEFLKIDGPEKLGEVPILCMPGFKLSSWSIKHEYEQMVEVDFQLRDLSPGTEFRFQSFYGVINSHVYISGQNSSKTREELYTVWNKTISKEEKRAPSREIEEVL